MKEKFEQVKAFWRKNKKAIGGTALIAAGGYFIGFLSGIKLTTFLDLELLKKIPDSPLLEDLSDYISASDLSKEQLIELVCELKDGESV